MLLLKVVPRRESLRKKHSISIPGHISQEMQMTFPEMFRKRNSLKPLDRMSRSRGSQQNAEIKSSIKSRRLLDTVTRSLGIWMRTVRRKAIFRWETILLLRMVTGSRRNISKRMITTAGIPIINPRKKENTTGGSIRTGNGQNNLILNMISRRRTKSLRKGWNRSFMEVKN